MAVDMPVATAKPEWAPKVSRSKIRRLYEQDAQGILAEDLIEAVGWALWERCDSILTVTAAHNGHVRCPGCGTLIERPEPRSEEGELVCERCGWRLLWIDYHRTYRGKQLFGANAGEDFAEYQRAFPETRTAREKMILIDRLIHAFHVGLKEVGRPAAANLIEGSLGEVIQFLDTLAGGPLSASGIGDSRPAWRRTLAGADWSRYFIDLQDESKDDRKEAE